MRQLLKNSWGLLFFLLSVFVGDHSAPRTDVAMTGNATIDSAEIQAVVDKMVFESLIWASLGDAPHPNRPIVYFDQNGNVHSLNTLPDLKKSFNGAYAVIALDSIPKHILELPMLKEAEQVNNVMVKRN